MKKVTRAQESTAKAGNTLNTKRMVAELMTDMINNITVDCGVSRKIMNTNVGFAVEIEGMDWDEEEGKVVVRDGNAT